MVYPFVLTFDIISLFAAEMEKLKIGISGKGLKTNQSINRSINLSVVISLSNDKNLDLTKFNTFAHDKINFAKMMISV